MVSSFGFLNPFGLVGKYQEFVQKLQSPVQVDFDPTGCLFDGLPLVIWTPTLDERQPDDALSPEVVYTDAGGRGGVGDGRGQVASHHDVAAAVLVDGLQGDSGLHLHLTVALP